MNLLHNIDMKKNESNQNNAYIPESGEEALAILIKEAGEEARKRKKKAMENHFRKLHAAICDTLTSIKQADSA